MVRYLSSWRWGMSLGMQIRALERHPLFTYSSVSHGWRLTSSIKSYQLLARWTSGPFSVWQDVLPHASVVPFNEWDVHTPVFLELSWLDALFVVINRGPVAIFETSNNVSLNLLTSSHESPNFFPFFAREGPNRDCLILSQIYPS